MLMPKRVKHRKQFRGSMAGKATRGNKLTYGEYGIVAMEPCWIKANQIEAARVAMTRYIKRGGKVWIKIFPEKPVTHKPMGVRMGKGKGALEYWVAVVKPGRVLFEISGVPEDVAREALRLATHISCVTTIIVIPSFARERITSNTSPTISGSKADVGSSNNITSGFIANARAIATRCFCPPDNLFG